MLLGTLVRDILLDSLNKLKNHLKQQGADHISEELSEILLYHASFSNFFDESLRNKVSNIYDFFSSKLSLNPEKISLLYDYASIIVLEKILCKNQKNMLWFDKVLNLLDNPSSSIRKFSTQLLAFYMHENIDFKQNEDELPLQEILSQKAKTNIEAKYADNIFIFTLISFLNISSTEKRNIFEELWQFSQEKEVFEDIKLLANFIQRNEKIPNPFFAYFTECQQTSLKYLIKYHFQPNVLKVGLQIDIFNQAIVPNFAYNFEDKRLNYFLMW